MIPKPFFPNPLEEFEPKKPDFEPETDPDYEEDCMSCGISFQNHTTRDIVLCALNELRGAHPKG